MDKKNIDLKKIINPKQLEKAKQSFLKIRKKIKNFFGNKQNSQRSIFLITLILAVIAIYRGISLYQTINSLNKNPQSLEQINQHNLLKLKSNPLTRNDLASSSTIYDLIENNQDSKNEITRYENYKESLLFPYEYFLQHILLPKLNIWKDPFTNKLSTDILWRKFLEENPYNDINLLQKWSDFFSTTNQNEINQIRDIKIWDIQEYDNWIFWINIAFSFVSPSQNALLFLVDKITNTSDQENLNLLWEFFFHLRQQIKIDKKELIEEIMENSEEKDIDKTIWHTLYKEIFEEDTLKLIDNTTINRAISNIMSCENDNDNVCFYKFRDKYKEISELTYTVWLEKNQNKTEDLKKFIKNLAPIMTIQDFVYTRVGDSGIIKQHSTRYEWKISLEIYWQNISIEEKEEIAKTLWNMCLLEDKEINTEIALNIIDELIRKQSNVIDENQNKTNNIWDLRLIIENIASEFDSLSNYKKTIRLFEIYRMLNENWLCKSM